MWHTHNQEAKQRTLRTWKTLPKTHVFFNLLVPRDSISQNNKLQGSMYFFSAPFFPFYSALAQYRSCVSQ